MTLALVACGGLGAEPTITAEIESVSPVPSATEAETAAPGPTQQAVDAPVLLHVEEFPDVLGPQGTTAFQLDAAGRLVRRVDTGWDELRLTDEGTLAFVEAAMRGGLLDEPAEYTTPADDYFGGFTTAAITVMSEGGPIMVRAINASDAPEADGIFERAYELIGLATNPPADWLIDAERPPEAWVPPWYTILVELGPDGLAAYPEPPDFPLTVEEAPLPLDEPILEVGEPLGGDELLRCAVISRDEAEMLRVALYEAGYERTDFDSVWAMFTLEWTAENGTVTLYVGAVPPAETPTCERFGE
jgi:hypothetical protein